MQIPFCPWQTALYYLSLFPSILDFSPSLTIVPKEPNAEPVSPFPLSGHCSSRILQLLRSLSVRLNLFCLFSLDYSFTCCFHFLTLCCFDFDFFLLEPSLNRCFAILYFVFFVLHCFHFCVHVRRSSSVLFFFNSFLFAYTTKYSSYLLITFCIFFSF